MVSECSAGQIEPFQVKSQAMYDSPLTLQECCVNYVVDRIKKLCEVRPSHDENVLKNMMQSLDIFFHTEVSQQLLETLGKKKVLNDQTLSMFDSSVTRLRKVKIVSGDCVTAKGLRVLRSHKISHLEAAGLVQLTVSDLIGCLGEWTLQNLKSLNVAGSTFTNSGKFCVVVALSKLRNLMTLNVSHTEFNKHGLEIVTEDLPLLENLDISGTRVKDISPLLRCKDRLKSLGMANLKNTNCDEIIPILHELHQLQHLDISDEKEHPLDILTPLKCSVTGLLRVSHCLPSLTSLDLSGKDFIDIDDLRAFLKFHSGMKFLGLVQTDICFDDMFVDPSHELFMPDLVVTGHATKVQILEALRRYPNRPFYVQKSLYHLYSLNQTHPDPNLDIIKLILQGMRQHPKVLGIQMAATACLYSLSKGNLGTQIHPRWLQEMVELTLNAMENFQTHQQLQKNTLLTLCSDRILQEVTFDRYRCAKLVMDTLVAFDDPSMNRMSVAICSILAAKISTTETSRLGSKPSYMQRLLSIVKSKMEEGDVDIMMKFTLSALWNLTDESPVTCGVFLDLGGLDLFLKVLKQFHEESAIETKVLGLLNNIAEVTQLRHDLMKDEFLIVLKSLLHSSHIDVSYFAAGIVAHLASDGPKEWRTSQVTRKEILEELGKVVLGWKTPGSEMVAYRSFQPFFPLLMCFDAYEVQLWSVWAIHHVCSKNPKRYCWMLVDEDGMEQLQSLLKNSATHNEVVSICMRILQVVVSECQISCSFVKHREQRHTSSQQALAD